MSVAELLAVLQKLSYAEKLSILEFLKADLDRGNTSSSAADSIHPRLQRKEGILVIETAALDRIDFNELIDQFRENRTRTQISESSI